MKAAAFDYRAPESLAEAVELLAAHGDDARPLAGGQSLVPMLAMRLARPAVLVDLRRIDELAVVEAGPDPVRIGAMVREARLETQPGLPPILAAALPHIGHFQIRSRGTVGGSLAHMDPAAEWPALAAVLDAEVEVASARGRRTILGADLGRGPFSTALEPDELIVAVAISGAGGRFGFEEVERRPGDFALAGAACHAGRVAVFAAGPGPQRLHRCEELLRRGGARASELVALAEAEVEVTGDAHAGAAYRRHVVARLVERAVRACASN